MEYARYRGVEQTVAAFEGGLARTSRSNSFYISYHRGLTTTLGPGTIIEGDNVVATFTQALSQRFSLQMDAAYTRGAGFTPDSSLESISSNAGIQVGLHRNLILSTNVGYVSQQVSNLPFAAPNLDRYTAYAGLRFFMPALRGR
jgi:hypothetical protein